MREDLLNILSGSNKDIDNQKLMDYLSGRLSAREKNEVEQWMMENPFFSEAMEGLQQAGAEKNVQATVNQLNRQLQKYLQQKKERRKKKLMPLNGWVYLVAVLIIIALAVVAYLVIRLKS